MHRLAIASTLTAFLAFCGSAAAVAVGDSNSAPIAAAQPPAKIVYPQARKVDHTDTYHGVTVSDPYIWLEAADTPESAAEWAEVEAWIEAQNKLTFGYLQSLPYRDAIRSRMTELWDYERYSTPSQQAGRYFYSRNTGLQKQSVVFVTKDLSGEAQVLLDPNALREDGTAALAASSASPCGRYWAYAISEAGSDWRTWKIRDLGTGKDLSDEIRWSKFTSASWSKDGNSFIYNRYKEPAAGEALRASDDPPQICLHRIGTPQSEDQVLYEMPNQKEWSYGAGFTDSGDFITLGFRKAGNVNSNFSYIDLRKEEGTPKITPLFDALDAQYSMVDHDGDTFWFVTDADAPRKKLIAVDIKNPAKSAWTTIIPEAKEAIRSVSCVADHFIVQYLQDARSVVKVYDLKGNFVRDVDLPGIGSASGFGGKRTDKDTFYSFTSYTNPGASYRYDVASGKSTLLKAPQVKFNPDDYTTTQVFYNSKDGTRVPMFISHRKDLKPTGDLPTLLYGYGGFNISLTPSFSPAVMAWLEMGGVYAVPNLRGGGEYGRDWHLAGTKTNKQNVFDDFIGAAEHLIKAGYTSPKKLAIQGGSNGGLLVGACMIQRPDLFGACLPAVGVMDMLKYHTWTVGRFWTTDYGSVDDPAEFKALYAYSPYHNLKKGTCYPATMITTGDHDDRVYPAHSFKFAAAAQEAQGCANPMFIRIDVRAGHGAGKPTQMRIEEAADMWTFLVRHLGMNVHNAN
jgi:prolyl oligopeptidase